MQQFCKFLGACFGAALLAACGGNNNLSSSMPTAAGPQNSTSSVGSGADVQPAFHLETPPSRCSTASPAAATVRNLRRLS